MDLIVHIEDGRIIGMGTYGELLSSQEKFSKLIEEAKTERIGQKEGDQQDSDSCTNDSAIEVSEEVEEFDARDNLFDRQVSTVSKLAEKRRSSSTDSDGPLKKAEDLPTPIRRSEKLIQKEKVETGRVKMNVYWQYAKSATYLRSFIFIFMYCAYAVVQMMRNVWLSEW